MTTCELEQPTAVVRAAAAAERALHDALAGRPVNLPAVFRSLFAALTRREVADAASQEWAGQVHALWRTLAIAATPGAHRAAVLSALAELADLFAEARASPALSCLEGEGA